MRQPPGRGADIREPDAFCWAAGGAVGPVGNLANADPGRFGHRLLQGPYAVEARRTVKPGPASLLRAERCSGNPREIPSWAMNLDVDANRPGATHRNGHPST